MKVLILTSGYPSDLDPVSGAFVREQARALKASHNVAVLCISGQAMSLRLPGEWQQSTEGGIEIWRTYLHHEEARPYLLRFTLAALTGFWKLRTGFQPDVIHAWFVLPAGFACVVIGRAFGIPSIITEGVSDFSRYFDSPVGSVAARWAIRQCSAFIAISHGLQQIISSYGVRRNIPVIPCIVDCELFRPTAMTIGTPRPVRVIYVGRMVEAKGVSDLLSAVSKWLRHSSKGVRLDLVGDGPDLDRFRGLAMDLGIADLCTFHGLLPSNAEVAQLMQASDFLVLPSYGEAFGVVLAEAMACGKPVIATRCGGPESFVTPETGLIIPPGDVDALTAALETMASNLTSYDPQRIAAYARESFGYQVVTTRLTSIYESVQRHR